MTDAALTITPEIRRLLADIDRFFAERDVPAYVAGGFLRDALLGGDVHDIDVSVADDPLLLGRELADSLGGGYFPLAEEQHVARVLLPERGLHVALMPLHADTQADRMGR